MNDTQQQILNDFHDIFAYVLRRHGEGLSFDPNHIDPEQILACAKEMVENGRIHYSMYDDIADVVNEYRGFLQGNYEPSALRLALYRQYRAIVGED